MRRRERDALLTRHRPARTEAAILRTETTVLHAKVVAFTAALTSITDAPSLAAAKTVATEALAT